MSISSAICASLLDLQYRLKHLGFVASMEFVQKYIRNR